MKNFKIVLLLFLVIVLLLNVVNCKITPKPTTQLDETNVPPTTAAAADDKITKSPATATDDDDTTVKTKSPKKPTKKPIVAASGDESTSEESTSLSTSESGISGSGSSIEESGSGKPKSKFNPKALFMCGDDIKETMSDGSSFISATTSVSDDPYQCFLSKKNVKFGKSMSLTLESKTCTADITACLGHKYTCSEVEHSDKMTYGSYSVMMAASPASNTISKIYASTGGKGQYSDIFFKVEGNTTVLKYGYTSYGKVTEFKNTISGSSFSIQNNYTFSYSQDTLVWYFNTRQMGEINTKYAGSKSPPPPLRFRVSLTNNENKAIKETTLPTTATVKSFNYVSVECPSDSESSDETNWGPQKASYKYFSSNCTDYRPIWIFNDTLNEEEGWTTELSNGTLRVQDTYFQRIGLNIAFGFNEFAKNLRFSKRGETFPIKRHKYLTFWLNGGYKGGQSLAIYLTLKKSKIGSVNLGDFLIGGIQKEHWYKVIIPMKAFQVSPPSITEMDGFMIQPTHNEFMDLVYFDDVMLTNGSVCMDSLDQMDVFKGGKLYNGDPSMSIANVNFESTAMRYKGKPTIEYQVQNINRLQLNFMNGSVGIDEYDGMIFSFYFSPDNAYIFQGQEDLEDSQHTYQRPLDCQLCLMNEQGTGEFPCLSLSEYLGGIFPSNRWVVLSIPWNDLAVDFFGARVGGVLVKTELGDVHQGALYISQISAAKFLPPHQDPVDSSIATKLPSASLSFYIIILFVSIILI